jgi:peptidoglycan/xylan/chitin deacetylase (PgdA/CDA1 family)
MSSVKIAKPEFSCTSRYSIRSGFWRLHRLFSQRQIPVTVFGVAMALARNPDAIATMQSPAARSRLDLPPH